MVSIRRFQFLNCLSFRRDRGSIPRLGINFFCVLGFLGISSSKCQLERKSIAGSRYELWGFVGRVL